MTDDQLNDLRDRAAALIRLLDDWEPGLFVWQGAVNDAWFNVVEWAPDAAQERLERRI